MIPELNPDGSAMVALFGTGRNGSSMLTNVLDGGPDLWVHPIEMNYLAVVSDLVTRGRVAKATAMNATTKKPLHLPNAVDGELLLMEFGRHLTETEELIKVVGGRPRVTSRSLLDDLAERATYSPSQFLSALLASSAAMDPESRSMVAFKSVETPYIEEYSKIFPGLRFVHIVRDPVDTYSSLKRTNMVRKGWPFWRHGGDELRTLVERRWIPHARFIVDEATRDTSRHFIMTYEELTANPIETVTRICSWLGVSPPSDPQRQTTVGGKALVNHDNPSGLSVRTPETVVSNMAKRFNYSDVLTNREKAFIRYRTHDLAVSLGYPASQRIPSRASLAKSWILPDAWERKNSSSSLALLRAWLRRRIYIYGKIMGRT